MRNILIIGLFVFSALFSIAHSEMRGEKQIEMINDSVVSLLEFTEETLKWRHEFKGITKEIKDYMLKNDEKIQSGLYLKIQDSAKKYVYKLHLPLQEVVEGKENFLLFNDFFDIQTEKPTSVTWTSRKQKIKDAMKRERGKGIRFKTIKVKRYSVNPYDYQGQLLLKSFKLQLAAKLVLLDNYLLALNSIFDDTYLRRTLLWDLEVEHEDVKSTLWHTWKVHYHDYQNPRDLYQADDVLMAATKAVKLSPIKIEKDKFEAVLDQLISDSLTFKIAQERKETNNFFLETAARIKLMNSRQRDSIGSITEETMYGGSKLFGNIAGSIYKGNGKLYNYTDTQLEVIEKASQPLDVIFEKTGFRLTDSFIPGHFTHAAIWAGTEEELKELGVWSELPAIYERAKRNYNYQGTDFQTAIKTKHYIIEALRPGVQINTLRHFMDIDDLVFLRPKTCEDDKRVNDEVGNPICLTKAMKKRYLIEAFKQIGKDYDFNFDVNTRDRIVCSELVYRTFLDTNFETEKTMGRHTIISDQIIPHADDENDLMYPILMIINGVKIDDDVREMQELLKILKAENYPEFEQRTGISTKY